MKSFFRTSMEFAQFVLGISVISAWLWITVIRRAKSGASYALCVTEVWEDFSIPPFVSVVPLNTWRKA
jgi:hypothetical protein